MAIKTAQNTKVTGSTERILAIDVGGTGLKAAIIDSEGQMKTERVRVATPHPCTPDQLVDALVQLVAPLVKQAPPTLMSIGLPGVVRNNRILTAPHFGVEGWHDIPLADSLAQRLGGLPVRMINDAEMQGFAAIEFQHAHVLAQGLQAIYKVHRLTEVPPAQIVFQPLGQVRADVAAVGPSRLHVGLQGRVASQGLQHRHTLGGQRMAREHARP